MLCCCRVFESACERGLYVECAVWGAGLGVCLHPQVVARARLWCLDLPHLNHLATTLQAPGASIADNMAGLGNVS